MTILLLLFILTIAIACSLSIVSGTVGAVMSAAQQKKATDAQARQAEEYNKLQRELFHETRGSEGSAILPEYLKRLEASRSARAGDISSALGEFYGSPTDVVNRGAGVAATYKPLLDLGTKSIYGIFSGDQERRRLAAAEPVFAARTALADTTRSGMVKGILDRLNAIRTANAAKGFVGTGSAAENLGFRASIEGNQGAAAATAGANLQNETDRRAIRDEILNLELRSPELAGALAAQAIRFETLPAEVAGAIQRGEMSPLDWFKIGVGQAPEQTRAPWIQPNASLGQILAGAGAQAGNTAARYFLNRDLANRYGQNTPQFQRAQDDFNYQYGGGGYPSAADYYGSSGGYSAYDYGGYGTGAGDAAFAGENLGY